jgi:DNA invertase Pin-like site-specific DNA recombinase
MNPKLTTERLSQRAMVYIRQSSPGQVLHNQESQRRQYGLVEQAREFGFRDIVVIDDDLGRTGSGLIDRPGFQRLVTEVCSGDVGAVFCIEASRLARNGRDWHHLIELCGLTGAVVIDPDGVYDPTLTNDRLLLGMKGEMAAFELSLLRQRSLEAIRQKARRGELRFPLPVGLRWTPSGKIEMDPDRRIQQALHLTFRKMTELGSVRQVQLWFHRENVSLPACLQDEGKRRLVWKLPVYGRILAILTNPLYAGAYAFGQRETRTRIVEGRARKTEGHAKPLSEWTVLIQDHHPGYISWEQYERNQAMIAANAHMKSHMESKAGRGGRALLGGLLRCRRCGRILKVDYTGQGRRGRYRCWGAQMQRGEDYCISFGAWRPDQAVGQEVLEAIGGNAVEAALEAAEEIREQRDARRRAAEMELEQAYYEARLSERRYEAVDPEQRLVAAELEARWNAALQKVRDLERKLQALASDPQSASIPSKEVLLSLAQDLPAVWNAPSTKMKLKQRIVRILIREIVVDIDKEKHEIIMLIHWAGGRHSELRIKKNAVGQHRYCTKLEAVEVVRRMAGQFSDEQIACTLNRLGMRTGAGNTWNEGRVYSLRHHHQLPAYDAGRTPASVLTLDQAAARLGVNPYVVRRLIEAQTIAATQVVPGAPWQIPAEAVESEAILTAIWDGKRQALRERASAEVELPMFPSLESSACQAEEENHLIETCRSLELERGIRPVR